MGTQLFCCQATVIILDEKITIKSLVLVIIVPSLKVNVNKGLYSKVIIGEGLHDTASVPFFVAIQKKYRAVA